MSDSDFHRARQPEQKAVRREAILAAAAALFDAEGPQGAGLNAIAAKAGFAKSNVYRYFESREAVLLSLFLDEIAALTQTLEARMTGVPVGDLPALAALISTTALARPRFCQLLSIIASMLEQNISVEVIADFKRQTRPLSQRLAAALHRVMPTVPVETCGWTWSLISAVIAALWPVTHPSPNAQKVYEMEEFACLRLVPERDIQRAVLIILRGASVPEV